MGTRVESLLEVALEHEGKKWVVTGGAQYNRIDRKGVQVADSTAR